MNKEIKYEKIDKVGIELLRKNNSTFLKSELSDVMKKIFLAANRHYGVTEIKDECYMKSGDEVIPGRIYYIYSDQLNKLAKNHIYDIVRFNGEECIWIYSKNAIDMIGEDPVTYTGILYSVLLDLFKPIKFDSWCFIRTENAIVKIVMQIRLMCILHYQYHVFNIDDYKDKLAVSIKWLDLSVFNNKCYSDESCIAFVNDVIANCNTMAYIHNREYLDSFMLLEEQPFTLGKTNNDDED